MNVTAFRRFLQGGRLLVFVAGLVVFTLLIARFVSDLYVDVLWFEAVEYLDVFWTRTLWQWGIQLVAGAVTAIIVFANLRVVGSTLGAIQIKRRVGDLEIAEKLPRSYIFWATVGASLLVGLWGGALLPEGSGVRTLLFLRAPVWGVADPVLGRDLSFYVFVLPMLRAILAFLLFLTFLLTSLCAVGYAATGSLGWTERGLLVGRTARIHLASLLGAFMVLLAFQFWVGQYVLLQDGNSSVQGIFGYTDARARLPGFQALTGLTLVCAAGFVWGAVKDRAVFVLAGVGTLIVGGVALLQLYPAVVQRFQVEPNELVRETPFIEDNMRFTRMGFGLDGLERRPFEYTGLGRGISTDEAAAQLSGFPVWTDGTLLTTFREVEARFRYYQFPEVDFDRYPSEDGMEVVAISARQIDPASIEDPNWQNLHLRSRYIAGLGAVASAATTATLGGRPPMHLSGIPPALNPGTNPPEGLALTHPSLYFGSRSQLYAVLSPGEGVFDVGGVPGVEGIDYPRGIRLDSPLRTLALAWRFRDANLLFSSEVTEESRFVFRRQVQERLREIAPFLEYFEAPYPVVHNGRMVWIQEGFTATRNLPLSSVQESGARRLVNYVRNSVKMTVDAVTGQTRFYTVDPDDPLLRAYARAFPDLFRPLDEMPEGLREHIRYPQSLLELQANVLQQYHQETAPRFHGQQDVWSRPQELGQGGRPVPYQSQYGYFRLPGEEEPGFLLTTAFVPVGRQNLTGILAARGDADHYGELVLLDVSVDDQVRGPRQVEALVEQDPVISEQFSLWRTGGSQVWTGHLHLVPVDGGLLYMEPIFLAAEEDAIPELARFVLSDGESVIMTPMLDDALAALAEGRGTPPPVAPGEDVSRSRVPEAEDVQVPERRARWSGEALEILDSAELRLRAGDWDGFGRNLERLRELLQDQAAPGPPDGS